MILAYVIEGLGVAIPLIVVFGIFIVSPFTRHRFPHPWQRDSAARLGSIADTQARILEELQTIRVRIEEVERVLATVE